MNLFLRTVTIITVLIAGYIVYDGLNVTQSAVLGSEILDLAPTEDEAKIEDMQVLNDDIVGWIRILDTDINYPILQADDNDYYLSRNYKKEFATAGSIFLDYRNNLENDNFAVIYGHRMSYGGMFTDVTRYKD